MASRIALARSTPPSWPAAEVPSPVTITHLGGVGEVGRNSTAIECEGRVIVIDYQTCWTSDLCAMASVTARVDLQPGRSYAIRQQAEGCDLWLALTTIVRSEPRTCRNDLWIEDGVSGERVWQGPSGDTAGRSPEAG